MAKITLSNKAILYLRIVTIICYLWVATYLILGFGYPDFTCAHAPVLASYADNFIWLSFVNLGSSLSAQILASDIRYTKLPDEVPGKESGVDSAQERAGLESAFGRYDRYVLASFGFLTTLVVGAWVHQVTVGMAVDCTQWKAAANGNGLQ
ncbi:hypothetical protein KC340_g8534 [Hortaea werneckii]|nr:hypothetical protein KC342_g6866 [Hortaea werneckii]KAI7095701.1 hypothetical protein KC339_g10874 [Hortaea werneckii]KAI7235131.1 hypothetical protein KC365_g5695 [Hortaea werneckii]KAI7316756.1 hypothetical protein KC340_g8534 [Hortaea werneckii]KAI7381597.1 hypothetical protein KC328_g12137 [Hortaea werneckii]